MRFGLWEPLSNAACICGNEPRWQVRQLVNLPKDGAYVSAKCTWCGFIFQYKAEVVDSDEVIVEENWREMDIPENLTWPSDGTTEIIERLRSVWNQENPYPFTCLCGGQDWQLAGILPFDRGADHRFRYRSDVKLRCLNCGYMALFGKVDEYGTPETHPSIPFRSVKVE
jgi:RNase P subunit RPR2